MNIMEDFAALRRKGESSLRLLITGAWAGAETHIPEIAAMGHQVCFLGQEREALPCDPAWVEGAVCNGLFLHHPAEVFPNLRFVQLTSAGLDRVPADLLRQRGVELRNARGVYSIPMAEFALAGVLRLYKQGDFFRRNQQRGVWEKNRDLRELFGRTVTILGCGSVGTECARRFAAFGCRVLGVDLFPRTDAPYQQIRPLKELDRLLPETDILVLTLPLTPETRRLMDRARLARLKPGAILVNISRGGVTEEAALAAVLAEGRLSGAVLDVFETEPLPAESPLWAMENVVLTPHNSFVGEGNAARLDRLILEALRELAGGQTAGG